MALIWILNYIFNLGVKINIVEFTLRSEFRYLVRALAGTKLDCNLWGKFRVRVESMLE